MSERICSTENEAQHTTNIILCTRKTFGTSFLIPQFTVVVDLLAGGKTSKLLENSLHAKESVWTWRVHSKSPFKEEAESATTKPFWIMSRILFAKRNLILLHYIYHTSTCTAIKFTKLHARTADHNNNNNLQVEAQVQLRRGCGWHWFTYDYVHFGGRLCMTWWDELITWFRSFSQHAANQWQVEEQQHWSTGRRKRTRKCTLRKM